MKLFTSFVLAILTLLFSQAILAQTTVFQSSLSNNLTACLNEATYTVNINNVSPYHLSDVEIRLILPDGISYVASSVTGGTENGPTTGNTILFDLPDLAAISNTVFTVKLTAGCMPSYSAKKNIVEFSYEGDNGIGGIINETLIHESNLYNVRFPNLSMVNMTNQSYSGSIGETITRCITITNGGSGALSAFELEHIHGTGLEILSSTMGTVTTGPNGSTYEFTGSDFTGVGNLDTLFNPGESITICEEVLIVSCSDAQSNYQYRWGCNSEVCQELSDAANITFAAETPHLTYTPWDGFSNNATNGIGANCYGNNVNGDFPSSITIVNDGSGTAINTIIDVASDYGGSSAWVTANYYSSINISSLTIEVNGGGEVPITPESTYAGTSKPCLPANPKQGFIVNIDTIAPGDVVVIRWNRFTCCPDYCDNNTRRSFLRWRFRGSYENNCGVVYDIPRVLSPNGHSRIYDNVVPDFVPGTMMDGDVSQISFLVEEFSLVMPRSSNDEFKYRLILPDGDCLQLDPNSMVITNNHGNVVNTPYTVATMGDTIDFIFNSVTLGSGWEISFEVNVDCTSCAVSGKKEVIFQRIYSPDLDCDCEMILGCSRLEVDVLCPDECEGANLIDTDAQRINLGLPDTNNDGIPDAGPHDMSNVKTNRMMYGDTLEISNISYIHNPNNRVFNSITVNHDILTHGNRMTYANSTVEIYRASDATVYISGVENIEFNTTTVGGNRSWNLGFDIHNLPSLTYPAGVHLETGDSVIVKSYYVNTSNIAGNLYTVDTESTMFATAHPDFTTTPAGDLYGCNTLEKSFTLIGYYFTTSAENSLTTQNCDEIVLTQNYYLSIGPCCNNYAGGNLFPFEYRHWASPGTMLVTPPDNYEYVSASFNFRRTAGTHVGSTSPSYPIDTISSTGNTFEFDLSPFFGDAASGNPILYGDDGFYGTLNVRIRPTCNVETGTKMTRYRWAYDVIEQLDPSGEILTGWATTDPVTYNGPILTMQSNALSVNSHTGVDSWDLFFQNTSYSSGINNFWIGAPVGGAITADSLLNTATNTYYYPNANGIFDIPDLGTDDNITYTLFTSTTSCTPASLEVYSGWSCSGVPNSLDEYECTPLNLTLSVTPLSPEFDSFIEFLGTGDEELCDTLYFEITARNYQLGYGYNMQTDLTIPDYLNIIPNSCYLVFGGDTINISDPTNLSGNTYQWDFSNNPLLEDGFSGIIDTTRNTYHILFKTQPLCGFTSGERIFIQTRGESFCGTAYVSDLNYSQSIILNNMSAPYATEILIDFDFLTPCGPDNRVELTIINNGPNSFGVEDSIHFTLPNGLTYDPNSFIPIHNAGIAQTTPTITSSGVQTILSWSMLNGIAPGDSMAFSVNLLPTPIDLSCQNIEFRAHTSVVLTASCTTDGNVCSAGFITGDTTKLVYTYKTELDILNSSANVHLNPDGSETLSGYVVVNNQGAELSSNYNLSFDIVQDLNGNGIIDAGEPVVWTEIDNVTILGGATDTLYFTGIDVTDFCEGIVRFSLGDNPCFCNEVIEPLGMTVSSTNFYDTICSEDALQIAYPDLGGFNYSWNLTGDLDDPTAPQPLFSPVIPGGVSVDFTLIRTIEKSICQQTDTSFITVNPLPTATIDETIDVCQNDTEPQVTFTGADGTAPYTFTYTFDDGTGAVTQTITTTAGNSVSIPQPTDVAGTFTYELISVQDNSSTTCLNAQTGTVTILVNPLPTATIDGTIDVCQDDAEPQVTFTGANGAAPYTFTYTLSDGINTTIETVTTATGNSVTVDAPTDIAGTFTYELVSVQDNSSTTCLNNQTGTVTVLVNSLPTATIAGTIDVCQDDTAPQVTFTGADGTAPYTFIYTFDDGTGAVTQTITTTAGNSVSIPQPTDVAGTFTYELVSVQDNSSTTCLNNQTGTVTVIVNPLPTATIAGTVDVCQEDTEPQVTFTGADGTAPYTFTYTLSDGTNITTETVTTVTGNSVTVDAPTDVAGTFTYELVSVQDNSSTTCLNNQTGAVTVLVNPLPTATIAGTVDVCQDDAEPQVTFTGADGTAPYTFTYTFDDGTGAVTQTITTTTGNSISIGQSTAVAGTFTYELVSVQDNSSTTCLNNQTGTVTVIVNPLPTATIAGTVDVCQEDTEPQVTFTGADGTAPYTFTYTLSDGTNTTTETVTTVTGNSVTVDAPTDVAGTFTYELVSVQDNSSTTCLNNQTGTVTVLVNSLPTATIDGTIDVCQNDTEPQVTFTGANGTAPYTFIYTFDDGTGAVTQTITTTAGNSVSINQATDVAGTFTYELVSVQDNSSTTCLNNQAGTVTILVNPLPTATIDGTIDVCQNDTEPQVTFTGASGTAPYTFTYTFDDGTGAITQTITTTAGNSISINQATDVAGTFTYELISVQDNSSTMCVNAQTGTVTILVEPLPTATIEGSVVVCQEDAEPQITFAGANGTAPYIFTYTLSDGITTTTETVAGSTVLIDVPTDVAGTFTYELLSVQDSGVSQCKNEQTGTVVVKVNPLPIASISGDADLCQHEIHSVVFEGANSTGNYVFTYNINNGVNQTVTSIGTGGTSVPVPTNLSNSFTYELTNVEDPITGCNRDMSETVTIDIQFQPIASFYPDPEELNSANWESTMVNESINSDNYFWDFGDGSFPSSEHSPVHEFPNEETANYKVMLIASSADGLCQDTLYKVIQFKNDLLFYIPNSFTPDGNEINNTFLPVFTAGYDPRDYSMIIFNRWGEIIFETHDTAVGWDGTALGKPAPDGTYVWKIVVRKTLTDEREEFVGHINLLR